ncbi:geranylgeranyl hydrogenase [Thalassobium sp. R2A62]|nr:geranylgeranyl hydrogenase [Thalassobium sp. R2A62]
MRLVLLCHETDVQHLKCIADLKKKLIKAWPMANLRNDIKNLDLLACLTRVTHA